MTKDPFSALADPSRRKMIGLLATNGRMTMGTMAQQFPDMSRIGVSKHVHYLADCGVVHLQAQGRETWLHLQAEALLEVQDWLQQYEQFWKTSLTKLGQYLDEQPDAPPA